MCPCWGHGNFAGSRQNEQTALSAKASARRLAERTGITTVPVVARSPKGR